MKILSKVTIPVLLLFLGGCAHYAGYYWLFLISWGNHYI